MILNTLRDEVHAIAREHGWHSPGPTFGESIALIHSELSEALEAYREGHRPQDLFWADCKPEGIPAELADVLIRVLDLCGAHEIDIQRAVNEKIDYNKTRPYRHGGKRL